MYEADRVALEPGDVLYIPYNCAHVARANDAVSLHLSLSVAQRPWSGLLQEIVAGIVTADPVFWGNPWLRGDAAKAELPVMVAALTERLRALDPAATLAGLTGVRHSGVEVSPPSTGCGRRRRDQT